MKKITMLTVVPISLAKQLCERKVVKDYNTLPQLNPSILETVREFMTDHVGYADLPMACLSKAKIDLSKANVGDSISTYLPINSNDSVLFQLDMPEDMIISVDFSELLEASIAASEAVDEDDLALTKESFRDNLYLGLTPSTEEQIIFIPFLDVSRCKFYARFSKDFDTDDLKLPGIEQISIRELKSFIE